MERSVAREKSRLQDARNRCTATRGRSRWVVGTFGHDLHPTQTTERITKGPGKASPRVDLRVAAATHEGKGYRLHRASQPEKPSGPAPRAARQPQAVVPQCSSPRHHFSPITQPRGRARPRRDDARRNKNRKLFSANYLWKNLAGPLPCGRGEGWRKKEGTVGPGGGTNGEKRGVGARKNLHMCRVMTLLRTRIDSGAPQHRFLDPTDTPLSGGWACKPRTHCWLPAGTPSVRQKQRPITNTAEVCASLARRTQAIYHVGPAIARACRALPAGRRGGWPGRAGRLG